MSIHEQDDEQDHGNGCAREQDQGEGQEQSSKILDEFS